MYYAIYDPFTDLVRARGVEEAALYARKHGFRAVEFLGTLYPPVPDVEAAREARRILEAHGLTVACYSVGTTLYRAPAEEDKLRYHAEIAAALGSPFLHHTLVASLRPLAEDPPFDAVLEDILPRAERVARHAAGLGLTCLYEEQGFYVNGIEQFGRFFGEMKRRCPNVGVCGDFGNILFADERPEDFLRAFAGDIRHVHIKDYRVVAPGQAPLPPEAGRPLHSARGAALYDVPLGEGVVDAAACLSVLREAGYDGALALEIGAPFPEGHEAVAAQEMAVLGALGVRG